jgi:hypothetical protein
MLAIRKRISYVLRTRELQKRIKMGVRHVVEALQYLQLLTGTQSAEPLALLPEKGDSDQKPGNRVFHH